MPSLDEMLKSTPYVAYTYSYPHKTTYRTFPEPLPLSKIWANEQREDLSLYIHVPFCEMRCGFCNLFTTANPAENQSNDYMKSLRRQAERTQEALETFTVTRLAIGGGTPTYLSVAELAELFEIGKQFFEITPASIPTSVETSPMTAQTEKLALLKEHGVDRISIGVQSFLEAEARAAGRPQKTSVVAQALENIRQLDFPTLNIDLIYGLPGQSLESWRESLEMALHYQPEELYLYPLYIRPLTGLGQKNRPGFQKEDPRLQYYRAGRDLLLSAGYTQISMRMFRANRMQKQSGPVYCTQDDGMLGLGCGARSYTSSYQYASEYAVSARGVRAILQEYMAMPASAFDYAYYGFHLNDEERRRRFVITSLFDNGGIDSAFYRKGFGNQLLTDFPELQTLLDRELITQYNHLLVLTEAGLEYSDVIGPWLYSAHVQAMMEGYQLQ